MTPRLSTDCAIGHPGVSIASSLTSLQFNDHIPGLLDAYNRILTAWPGAASAGSQLHEKEQVIEHGLQRWQQGYRLRDLTREWGHLHLCVSAKWEEYAQANSGLDASVMHGARQAWSKLCWDGISGSSIRTPFDA